MGNINADILDIKNWKMTSLKKHDVYVCMPKVGTPWVNKLNSIQGETDASTRFILSDILGDKIGISANELAKNYRFMSGENITKESLTKRRENGVIDWMHLEARSGAYLWAFHLSIRKYGSGNVVNYQVSTPYGVVVANKSGIPHGEGDFLICADNCGRPDFSSVQVVNGELFVLTYNMRGFPNVAEGKTVGIAPVPRTSIVGLNGVQTEDKGLLSKLSVADIARECGGLLGSISSILLYQAYLEVLIHLKDAKEAEKLFMKSKLNYGIPKKIGEDREATGVAVLAIGNDIKIHLNYSMYKAGRVGFNLQTIYRNENMGNKVLSASTTECLNLLLKMDTKREWVGTEARRCAEIMHKHDIEAISAGYKVDEDMLAVLKEVYKSLKKSIKEVILGGVT